MEWNGIFLRVQPSYHSALSPFDLSNRVKRGMKKERGRRWSSGMRQRIQNRGLAIFRTKIFLSLLSSGESPGESKMSTFFQKNASDLFLAPRLPRLPCDLLFHRFIASLSLSLFSLSLSLSSPFVAQFHLIRSAPTKSSKTRRRGEGEGKFFARNPKPLPGPRDQPALRWWCSYTVDFWREREREYITLAQLGSR